MKTSKSEANIISWHRQSLSAMFAFGGLVAMGLIIATLLMARRTVNGTDLNGTAFLGAMYALLILLWLSGTLWRAHTKTRSLALLALDVGQMDAYSTMNGAIFGFLFVVTPNLQLIDRIGLLVGFLPSTLALIVIARVTANNIRKFEEARLHPATPAERSSMLGV